MRFFVCTAVIALFAATSAACSASEVAPVTSTSPVVPPSVAVPAFTPTLAPTEPPPSPSYPPTAEPVPTTTPKPDGRVVDTHPRNLLLDLTDLPAGEYEAWPPAQSPGCGDPELLRGWVDDWMGSFHRISGPAGAPSVSSDTVDLYLTTEAARKRLEERAFCRVADPVYKMELVDRDLIIGDATIACTSKSEKLGGGYYLYYYLEFTRRNVYHQVVGDSPEYVQEIARQLLEKVDQAPLASEVTYRPECQGQ
jgi:hypothetical protein